MQEKTYEVRIKLRQGPHPGAIYKTTEKATRFPIAASRALRRLMAMRVFNNYLHRQIDISITCIYPKRGSKI